MKFNGTDVNFNSHYFFKTRSPFVLKSRKSKEGLNRNAVNKKKLDKDMRNWR